MMYITAFTVVLSCINKISRFEFNKLEHTDNSIINNKNFTFKNTKRRRHNNLDETIKPVLGIN